MTNVKRADAMAQVAAAFADIKGLKFVRTSADHGSIKIEGSLRSIQVRANHSACNYLYNSRDLRELCDQVLFTSDRTKPGTYGRTNETRRFPVGKDGNLNAESMRAAVYQLADVSIKAEAVDNERAQIAAKKEQAREAVKAKLRERGLMKDGQDFGYLTFRGIDGRIHVNQDGNIALDFGALSLHELLTLISEEVRS